MYMMLAQISKIFPAGWLTRYLKDVKGPVNHVEILAAGVNEENFGDFRKQDILQLVSADDL